MMYLKKIILLAVFFSLTACGENNNHLNPLSEKENQKSENTELPGDDTLPINRWPAFDWDNKHQNYLQWNRITFNGITNYGLNLLSRTPSDIKSFCPKYKSLNEDEAKLFWVSLLAAMARYESGFNPEAWYKENFKNSEGEYIISRGLLQLSRLSSRAYGCPVEDATDLHISKINLECSIRILDRWIGRDGVISNKNSSGKWRGGARYWAVLRKASTLAKIKDKTNQFEFCN